MGEPTDIVAFETQSQPILNADALVARVAAITDIMRRVMVSGEHYGVIPGCGDKPTLLKAGAEKLMVAFGLRSEVEVEERELVGEHREYRVKCRLFNRDDLLAGEGMGSASTMEAKFRFRSESTGKPVPGEYWQKRDNALLGGPGFHPRKIDGQWVIAHRVEHDSPADYYNTVLKMALKRARVDAVLTTTAASDIFTQDLEDTEEAAAAAPSKRKIRPPRTRKAGPKEAAPAPPQGRDQLMRAIINAALAAPSEKAEAVKRRFEITGWNAPALETLDDESLGRLYREIAA